jgi:hypothetical protein
VQLAGEHGDVDRNGMVPEPVPGHAGLAAFQAAMSASMAACRLVGASLNGDLSSVNVSTVRYSSGLCSSVRCSSVRWWSSWCVSP